MQLTMYKMWHVIKEPFNNKSLLPDGIPSDCRQQWAPSVTLKVADLFYYNVVFGHLPKAIKETSHQLVNIIILVFHISSFKF